MNNSHQPNISINSSASVTTRGTVQIVVESCIFLVLNIAALVGNVLVCLAWYRNPSLRTVTNIFILSLALADLLMAVTIMPLSTARSVANKWIGEYTIESIFSHILAGTELITVMLLAVNRYVCVVKTASYTKIYSKKRSTAMAVCAWIGTSLVCGVVYPIAGIQFRINPNNPAVIFPDFRNPSALIVFMVIYNVYLAVPSVVIAACYVRIYQTIRQHNAAAVSSSQGRRSAYGVEEAKITRLLTAVLVGFYLCWLPSFITNNLSALGIIGETDCSYINLFYNSPLFASSVINPIIYATMTQSFRKEFLKILRGIWYTLKSNITNIFLS